MAVSEDFARLTDPFRPELLAHCYRMLGWVHEAEDQVQEPIIRAWRSYGECEGRASLRTWLYRIATNACLRALEKSSRRPLPSRLGGPSEDPEAPLAAAPPGVSVAASHSRRAGQRRVRRSSRDRGVAAEHAAGPDRRLAVPARPAARRADPARRAALAGRGGRRLARHDHGRGEPHAG